MKRQYKVLIGVLGVLVLAAGAFTVYVMDYYRAETTVETMAQTMTYETKDNFTIFTPETPGGDGLIFYPGGKVEETAYYPLMESLRENGVTCVLVTMPFRLAVLNTGAADGVYELLPDVENWYIGGHSLGGAMASSYAASHPDEIDGLILLGAYVYGDVPPGQTLTIYGSNDLILDRSRITDAETVVVIEGGNHAYFGNYGEQDGDGAATITQAQQQAETVAAILSFMQ